MDTIIPLDQLLQRLQQTFGTFEGLTKRLVRLIRCTSNGAPFTNCFGVLSMPDQPQSILRTLDAYVWN